MVAVMTVTAATTVTVAKNNNKVDIHLTAETPTRSFGSKSIWVLSNNKQSKCFVGI